MNLILSGPHFLDTSAAILMMRNGLSATSETLIPFATLGELSTGIARVDDRPRESAKVGAFLRVATVIYPTRSTIEYYARTSAHLQRIGKPIPVNDLWNAALALQWDLPLLADDTHFARVPGLKFIPAR